MKVTAWLGASVLLIACSGPTVTDERVPGAPARAFTSDSLPPPCQGVSGKMDGDIQLETFSFGSRGQSTGGVTGSYKLTLSNGQRDRTVLRGPGSLTIEQTGGPRVDLSCFIITRKLDNATPVLFSRCSTGAHGLALTIEAKILLSESLFRGVYRGTEVSALT